MNEFVGIFKDTRKHLMNGVSHMIPFVVTGGILMAVAVMAYGQGGVPPEGTWMATLWTFGSTALNLMVPVLSAYIAASIADRAGICPGFVGGMISINVGAGFLGGIVTGLLGGVVCYYLKKIKVPKALSSIMPIMIIPIVGSLVTMGFMQYILGAPIAMGCVGITEGAIPFAANDPLRVIPSTMIGAAVGGAVGYLFNITNPVAWSGLIMLPVLGNPIGFLVSLAAAVGVTAGLMILLKKDITENAADTEGEDLEIDLSFE